MARNTDPALPQVPDLLDGDTDVTSTPSDKPQKVHTSVLEDNKPMSALVGLFSDTFITTLEPAKSGFEHASVVGFGGMPPGARLLRPVELPRGGEPRRSKS